MSGPELGEPEEKVDHLELQDRREVKMYLASVDETSQTVVYSDAVSTLDLKPQKKKCDCTVLNSTHEHNENSLLITPFGIYLFPPMIDGFLITSISAQYHIKDIALVSLPYRNEKAGESDVVWRANDVVVHFLDSSCLWLQTRAGQRSLVAEVLSDTYEALMGVPLEMHQPDCDELSLQIVGLGTAAEKTFDEMIAGFRAEAQLRMKTVSMQGWLNYTSCIMPENENGPVTKPPPFQLRYVVLSSSDRLYIFRSPAELEATRCVSPNFNSRKITYNLPSQPQHTRRVSYNLPSPPAPVALNTKKKLNRDYTTMKLGQLVDSKLPDEANGGGNDNQSIILDLNGAACLWAKHGFDIIETRHIEKSTRWTYKSKRGSVERFVHLFAAVPIDKTPEGSTRTGLGLAHATSSLGFNLAPADEKAENVLWVSRIERAIYNKVGRVFKQQEQDLRILKLIREEASKPEPPAKPPTTEAKEAKADSKESKTKEKTKEELEKERDIALYSIKTLNELTNDPFGKELLWKFCKAQFNEENMKYLEAVEEYEAVFKDPNQSNKSVITHGRRMCDQFFVDDAPCLLNISSGLRNQVLETFKEQPTMSIERPPANVFHATTQEIYKLLNTNSFKLFSKSEYHQQWIDYRKECVAQEEQKKKTLNRLKSSLMGTLQPRKAKPEDELTIPTASAVIRIPGRFFEHSQLQSIQLSFPSDTTVHQIVKLVIPQLLAIPGARPSHLLPESFTLFRLDGRDMFQDSQSLTSQVPPGPIEVLLKEAEGTMPPPQPLVVETMQTHVDSTSYSELWGEWDTRETVKTRRRAVLEERPLRAPAAAAAEPDHPSFASLLQQLQGVLAKNRPPLTTHIDRESLTVNPSEDYSKLLHDHLQLLIRTATRVSSQDTHASSLASPSSASSIASAFSSFSSASSSSSSSSSSSAASYLTSDSAAAAAPWRPRTPSLTSAKDERSRSNSGSGRGRPLDENWMSPARKHSISHSGSRARSLSQHSVSSDRRFSFSGKREGEDFDSSAALAARLRPLDEHEASRPFDA